MSRNLPPDGTLFYFTRRLLSVKAPNSGIPIVDVDTVTDYDGLALRYAFYRGTLDNGKLVYMETWERTEQSLPGSFVAAGSPLSDITIDIPDSGIADQKARFFRHDTGSETWVDIPYAETEGDSDFIRVFLVAIPDSDDTATVFERIQQRLVTRASWEYDANGNAITETVAEAETGFEPVTRALPQMND